MLTRAAFTLILIATPGISSAQNSDPQWQDLINVGIQSAVPTTGAPETLVRLPSLTDHAIPATQMPKALAAEKVEFIAKATATVVIGADDQISNCHMVMATIQHGLGQASQTDAPLALDACPLLVSENYHHALGADGHPLASKAEISLFFSRVSKARIAGRPPAPPPVPMALTQGLTSGHVLPDNGDWWTDRPWWLGATFVIAPSDWSASLTDRRDLPQAAKVGVLLKLTAKNSFGMIDACTVALSSGNEKLDTATCNVLKASTYTNHEGMAFVSTSSERDAYPVLVQWRGTVAKMTYPAMPTVPHMPHDVILLASDRPGTNAPKLLAIPIEIMLNPAGRATGCKVLRTSGDDMWDAVSCRIPLQRAKLTAPVDWFGRPAKGVYDAVADWDAMTIHPAHQ